MRIPALERHQAPAEVQPLYDSMGKLPPQLQLTYKVLAHAPRSVELFRALSRTMSNLELPPRLRELAFIRASRLNRSDS